jgi:hypothetical protein
MGIPEYYFNHKIFFLMYFKFKKKMLKFYNYVYDNNIIRNFIFVITVKRV